MSINRRYRRADLVISPLGCLILTGVVLALVVASLAWSR